MEVKFWKYIKMIDLLFMIVIDLLSRMTISEKVGQVNQHLYGWKTYNYKKANLN